MGGTRRSERSLLHVAKTEFRVSRLLERRGCAVPLALSCRASLGRRLLLLLGES